MAVGDDLNPVPGSPAAELGPGLPASDANVSPSYTGVEEKSEYDDPDQGGEG